MLPSGSHPCSSDSRTSGSSQIRTLRYVRKSSVHLLMYELKRLHTYS